MGILKKMRPEFLRYCPLWVELQEARVVGLSKNICSWYLKLADLDVPDTIQPRENSMGGGTDGFKYERRGLPRERQLER
jgi:hypothetical protein